MAPEASPPTNKAGPAAAPTYGTLLLQLTGRRCCNLRDAAAATYGTVLSGSSHFPFICAPVGTSKRERASIRNHHLRSCPLMWAQPLGLRQNAAPSRRAAQAQALHRAAPPLRLLVSVESFMHMKMTRMPRAPARGGARTGALRGNFAHADDQSRVRRKVGAPAADAFAEGAPGRYSCRDTRPAANRRKR